MKLRIEIGKETLKQLVIDHLCNLLTVKIDASAINIEVRNTLHYGTDWEDADFRAVYEAAK
jgi:hypothetical protein